MLRGPQLSVVPERRKAGNLGSVKGVRKQGHEGASKKERDTIKCFSAREIAS